ncbi:MAG: regulator, partial [Anaerolineales bacterium]|nr:regulator [Anaerolineales bacterium]
MMRKAIRSDQAPKPRGPYTPAIIASGPMVYLSSQGPIDPATDQPRGGSFTDQARQVFDNVSALLT